MDPRLEKLKRYKELKERLRKVKLKKSLTHPTEENSNPNYRLLHKAITEQKFNKEGELVSGYSAASLRGSSRSGKTWSSIDIIIWLCTEVETNCTINIYRSTYNEFKTTLYDDFKRRLEDFNLPNPFVYTKEIKSFNIGKNRIYFLGDGKHGGGCDYAFYNEVMDMDKSVVMQSKMRCRKFWWGDYNPSFTDHWWFDIIESRDDVACLRTTFLDNPFISPKEKIEILGYEPWEIGSYEVYEDVAYYKGEPITEDNQPPEHVYNVKNGTADEFMWKVYGLGLKGAMEGVIFSNVKWIDEWPIDIAHTYANDFGFTIDPNATVKYGEDENNIYVECLIYRPIETPEELNNEWYDLGIPMQGVPIPCDSSDKYVSENKGTIEMVLMLQELGWVDCYKISKTKSIMFWITSMKKKKIHIVKNKFYKAVKKELENYKMKEVNGILINQPIDKHNHFWDAARYGHISHNSLTELETSWD